MSASLSDFISPTGSPMQGSLDDLTLASFVYAIDCSVLKGGALIYQYQRLFCANLCVSVLSIPEAALC